MLGGDQLVDAAAGDRAGIVGLDHVQTGGVHLQQGAVGRDQLHTFGRGFDHRPVARLARLQRLIRPLPLDGQRRGACQRLHQAHLLGRRLALLRKVSAEGAEHEPARGQDRHRPGGPQPELQRQVGIGLPGGVGRDVGCDDDLAARRRRGAGPDARGDGDTVHGARVTRRQARRGAGDEAATVAVDQQDGGARRSRRQLFGHQAQRRQHLGERTVLHHHLEHALLRLEQQGGRTGRRAVARDCQGTLGHQQPDGFGVVRAIFITQPPVTLECLSARASSDNSAGVRRRAESCTCSVTIVLGEVIERGRSRSHRAVFGVGAEAALCVEFREHPAEPHQLRVAAALDEPAVLEHQDGVGGAHR